MRTVVEARTPEGAPLVLEISTKDVVTHSYFSVAPAAWEAMLDIIREALRAQLPHGRP